jgi:hypothetical protein
MPYVREIIEHLECLRQESELMQTNTDAGLVEDAHDDLLAEYGGKR